MSGAELRFLQDEFQRRIGECGRHGIAAVAVYDDGAIGVQRPGTVQHVSEQRLAAQCVQDFRQTRMHAFALAGSEDHDVEGGVFHRRQRKRSELSHNAPERRCRR
jgi:hypothetical protein